MAGEIGALATPDSDPRRPADAPHSRSAPKVSQASSRPLSRPVRNQRTRWAELPWVKLSGLTVPRA